MPAGLTPRPRVGMGLLQRFCRTRRTAMAICLRQGRQKENRRHLTKRQRNLATGNPLPKRLRLHHRRQRRKGTDLPAVGQRERHPSYLPADDTPPQPCSYREDSVTLCGYLPSMEHATFTCSMPQLTEYPKFQTQNPTHSDVPVALSNLWTGTSPLPHRGAHVHATAQSGTRLLPVHGRPFPYTDGGRCTDEQRTVGCRNEFRRILSDRKGHPLGSQPYLP